MSTSIYCQQCGDPIKTRKAEKFCSRSCAVSFNNHARAKPRIVVQCEHCDDPIETIKEVRFCSTKCSNLHRVRVKTAPRTNCPICGVEAGYDRKYCFEHRYAKPSRSIYTPEQRRRRKIESVQRYYAKRKNQTPPDADMEIMKQFYMNCPEGYEVDHIHPISKGGLHHQDNLQYLTIHENRSKGAKLNWKKLENRQGI